MSISFRAAERDMLIIQQIITEHSKPGLKITQSDAIRIALAYWEKHTFTDMLNDLADQEAARRGKEN